MSFIGISLLPHFGRAFVIMMRQKGTGGDGSGRIAVTMVIVKIVDKDKNVNISTINPSTLLKKGTSYIVLNRY